MILVFSFDWALIASGFLDYILTFRGHFNFVPKKEQGKARKLLVETLGYKVDFGMFPYATHHMTGYATLRPFADTRVSFDLSPYSLDRVLVFRDHFNFAP